MRRIILALLVATTAGCLPVSAAIYSYRDERGRLFLTDNPPNSKYQIVVPTRKDREGPDLPSSYQGTAAAVAEMAPQKILLPNDESFSEFINEAAQTQGLDPYLIKAVIKVESDFDPNIVSSKGACGLMQLIPGTAKLVKVTNVFDPRDNIHGGARYLRMMVDRFSGRLDYALAGYNAGPGRVEQYGGIPPIRETKNYVTKVNHYLKLFRSGQGLPPAVVTTRTVRSIPVIPSALSQKLNAAYAQYLDNNVDGAIRSYQDILNIFPKNTQALYNLACLLDMERRYDEAIEAYQASVKQDPFLDKSLYNLAIIYERLGQHREAIACWRRYTSAVKEEEKIALAERYVRELVEYAALNP